MESDNILYQHPNLILLHAGTNDNHVEMPNESYADAPKRLGVLIDYILCECYDAVLLVAELIQDNANQTQTTYFNSKVPDIVAERYKKGYKVRVVNQSGIGGNLLDDGTHPNDAGYSAMAQNWMDAINNLPGDWLTPARDPSSPPVATANGAAETCAKNHTTLGQAIEGNVVFAGAHVSGDPGEPMSSKSGEKWVPQWDDQGLLLLGIGRAGSGVILADLDGSCNI